MDVFIFQFTDNEIIMQKIIFWVEIVDRFLSFNENSLKADFLRFKKARSFDDLEEV
jgi:hypothetical protein